MTTRERFNRVFHWQKVDRVPDVEFGYWEDTITAWHSQGLPRDLATNIEVERHLGLEGVESFVELPVTNGLHPGFQYEVLEERGEHNIVRDEAGATCEVLKHGSSIPRYLKYGLETREDWEFYRDEHLDFRREDRIGDVRKAVEEGHKQGIPVRFSGGSLYGWLRNWMGVENISIAIMTDRDWVEEMMEHLTLMTLHLIEKAFPGVEVDMAWWWEDMCFNHGPLLSPKLFHELMVPRYRRITDALKKHGVDMNVLDCDGRIYELVPGWLEGGINGMFPIEAAHTDALRLRKEHGQSVFLLGGVDKVQLAKGKDAIDRELERLRPLVEAGGYIPCVDHRVPPDVSFENYLYYLEKKKDIL